MDQRREFLKKASLLASGAGLLHILPASVARALAINPAPGSTYLDAEHIVLLMQENRSFDHTYGTLQGVRGFNDPRAITIPGNNLVWLQSDKDGNTYAPFRFDIKGTKITWMSSLPHSWANQVDARNEGRHDQWIENKHSGNDDYAGMPLTMGYYTREDIPFYYSFADAFTVCDQHFCSSLTGTTPNRLYFWTGTIREKPDENTMAHVWNQDADYETTINWKTFPERLETAGISWKIYQNELSVGTAFEGEEEPWLANFGDNPIEVVTQFNVKLHPEYISSLPKMTIQLKERLGKKQQELAVAVADSKEAKQLREEIDWITKRLEIFAADKINYTTEKFEQLSEYEKNLHRKAFVTNREDPFYHELETLHYKESGTRQEVKVPKGDVLNQFRQDVNKGELPLVSWIVAPENFSDHPSSAWYGAWYVSEVLDILTSNPEVWKKTIFILTYDENDGYFDHVPPFVAPHPVQQDTGLVSPGLHTGVEYVADNDQQSDAEYARVSPIGLGYRVPMVIASPWSRGGWVNSEVCDHTSSLQFLEKFLSYKTGKKIEEPNISAWRRAVCGDLRSAFRTYEGEDINHPASLKRNDFIRHIHQAQFKNPPSNFRKLTKEDIEKINNDPQSVSFMASQEKGIRSSCALPYELYADGQYNSSKQSFEITMKAGNEFFKNGSGGSPFQVYAPGRYGDKDVRAWSYAVTAGDSLKDAWPLREFDKSICHLRVYGPNGFFREFKAADNDPSIEVKVVYEQNRADAQRLTGNITIGLNNLGDKPREIVIRDNSYKASDVQYTIGVRNSKSAFLNIVWDTTKSFGWYDFSVLVKGAPAFERRYAGRVETGWPGKTDPLMGKAI